MQPKYKRVLLKLSGEALAGDQRFGLNHDVIAPVVDQIIQIHKMGVQVGLVIGKLSSALDKGFVFDLVPTPLNDAGESPCSLVGGAKDDKKKGSKSKATADSSSLFIDKDWVAEQARQVIRLS